MPPRGGGPGGPLLGVFVDAGYESAVVAAALKRFCRAQGVAEAKEEHAVEVRFGFCLGSGKEGSKLKAACVLLRGLQTVVQRTVVQRVP